VTRDRASAYAQAVEEVLPDCMQVADRFHLHQNLMDAVNKIIVREIPATSAVPIEDTVSESGASVYPNIESTQGTAPELGVPMPNCADSGPETAPGLGEGKKIPFIVDNLTESEAKRLGLIQKIQELHQKRVSVCEIARITSKNCHTVKKYLEGDPYNLCQSKKQGAVDAFKDFIVKAIRDGKTQSSIAKQLKGDGV